MAQYRLSCNPATRRASGMWMVSYSLRGDVRENEYRDVEIKDRETLEAAMVAAGSGFLDANPDIVDGCQVSNKPATRHAKGCKAAPYSIIVERKAEG